MSKKSERWGGSYIMRRAQAAEAKTTLRGTTTDQPFVSVAVTQREGVVSQAEAKRQHLALMQQLIQDYHLRQQQRIQDMLSNGWEPLGSRYGNSSQQGLYGTQAGSNFSSSTETQKEELPVSKHAISILTPKVSTTTKEMPVTSSQSSVADRDLDW